MTWVLVLCLACAMGGNTVNIPRPTQQACEADAARFQKHPGTVAECIRETNAAELAQQKALDMAIEGLCHGWVKWHPPAAVAQHYNDIPRTMDECRARYSASAAAE